MSGYILAHKDYKMYVKEVDTANQKLEYTNDINEAKVYETEWFAQTELEYLMFHFESEQNTLQNMKVSYKRNNDVDDTVADTMENLIGEDEGDQDVGADETPW